MKNGSAFPIRETITKAAAVSYILARATYICVQSEHVSDAALRLLILVAIETPIFVILVAVAINLVLLEFLSPRIRRAIASMGSRGDRPARPADRQPDPFHVDHL